MALVNYAELRDGLRCLYARSQRLLDRIAVPYGVTSTRLVLMTFIDQEGSVRSADIIREFSLAPRTVTEAIDAMEADGHAERRPDPADRRAKLVSLTSAGLELMVRTKPHREQMAETMFGALSKQELDHLVTSLQKLNTKLAEMENAREQEPPSAA